jgi:hypothetical protein
MSAGKNDRAAPTRRKGGFEIRFANKAAAEGWEDLARSAPHVAHGADAERISSSTS